MDAIYWKIGEEEEWEKDMDQRKIGIFNFFPLAEIDEVLVIQKRHKASKIQICE